MNKTAEFRTSGLYYAAYLKVAGVRFSGTATEGKRVFFVFERPDGLRDLKNQYFNRVAKVPTLSLVDEIRAMKQLTHEPM